MRFSSRVLIRCAALALLASLVATTPGTAKADLLDGASIRVGSYLTTAGAVRDVTGAWAPGIGIDVPLPWTFPVTGENWKTSLSVDMHYRDWKIDQVFRYLAVSLNQVYVMDEGEYFLPYLGYCITAATFGNSEGDDPRQATITRWGVGLILGANLGESPLYLEARYELFGRGSARYVPNGFRCYLGYRF